MAWTIAFKFIACSSLCGVGRGGVWHSNQGAIINNREGSHERRVDYVTQHFKDASEHLVKKIETFSLDTKDATHVILRSNGRCLELGSNEVAHPKPHHARVGDERESNQANMSLNSAP